MNAQPSLFDPPAPRLTKPQTLMILRVLRENGSITREEAYEFRCWNLPARIREIRLAYGDGAVVSVSEPNRDSRGTHDRYYWRGDRAA